MSSTQRFDSDLFFMNIVNFVSFIAIPALVPTFRYVSGVGSGHAMASGMIFALMMAFYWIGGLTDGYQGRVTNNQFHIIGGSLLVLSIIQFIFALIQ